MKPLVSLTITSYNRLPTLRACLESFWATNTWDSVELIIVDNASTDKELKRYIRDYEPPQYCKSYKVVWRSENDYPYGQKKSRIEAREIAKGDFVIDCPDDHLFVVQSNWIEDCVNHIQSDASVGCVVHYAQPAYRWQKPNNEWRPHESDDNYVVSLHKGYADYHIMSFSAYEDIGPFKWALGRGCEGEYMQRALDAGYRRHVMRVPVAIINDLSEPWELVAPLRLNDSLKGAALSSTPVTNEQLIQIAHDHGAIRKLVHPQSSRKPSSLDPEVNQWLNA